MSWKATFDKGVACFKCGHLDDALTHMNQAAEMQSNAFIIYDSRAAVYEKLGNTKDALLDSKRVIDLAPGRWQGYARSARLFNLLGKYSSAVKMADHALSRLRPEDVQRHAQLIELREMAVVAQAAAEVQVTQSSYLLGKLPVETLVEIFTFLINEDHTCAVKLSHVCGHWRQILINTPSAWQLLVLSHKHPLRKAKLWKQRAKNMITRIFVGVSLLDRASVFAELQDLSWDKLSSLSISADAITEFHDMLSNISLPHVFSQLDELTLLDLDYSARLACCLSGPNWQLRILRISHRGYASVTADEWWQRIQQLKELYISGDGLYFFIQVFTANRSLERLVLDGPRAVSRTVRPEDFIQGPVLMDNLPVPMDNLKSVVCRRISNPFDVLCDITAPSITHFEMCTINNEAEQTLLHMASRPSLVELRVASCSLSSSALPRLLSSTPNLEILQINNIHAVANELFEFLTPKMADALPCRALKHVNVSGCSDLTTSSVYAFVKTRAHCASESVEPAEKCAVIASLKVDGCSNIEPDMLPWFRSKVAHFSCVYATKKDFRKDRRQYP